MSLLTVTNLTHDFGGNVILRNVNFELFNKERMGLVGHNGSGKSTLLKILIGDMVQESGDVWWHPKANVGYLDQYVEIDTSHDVRSYLQTAFKRLYELDERYHALNEELERHPTDELIRQAASAHAILDKAGFYELDTYINKVCSGLGVTALGMDTPVEHLSGGQRAKVILAKLLLENPDVLLLDEPTNFLDRAHIDWLTKYLKSFEGAFIVVSHDFDFLDSITTCICDIENLAVSRYKGNLTAYLQYKNKRKEQYIKEYTAQQKFIEKTEDYIRRNKARASTSNMAKSREKMLAKVERMAPPKNVRKVHFRFKYTPLTTETALEVKDLKVGYYYPILPPISFTLKTGKRMVVTGFNGVGKSTLIKTLMGDLPGMGGTFKFGERVVCGYFRQDTVWENDAVTPFQFISSLYPKFTKKEVYAALAKVGITNEHIEQQLSTLSGGEQAKVRICHLMLTPCNLLVLDEPTNHLDINTKIAFEEAIAAFEGGLILISHDHNFYAPFVDDVLDIAKLIVK